MPTSADRELVAKVTSEYDLVAVPVVDGFGRIVGVITVDDVIDAIVEEQTEDVQRLGAVQPLEDPYFVERKLFPNVDFYSGIILQAVGFPTSMFTVLFAVARTVGWVAQWNEMIEDPEQRISRPRQLYTGHDKRAYVAMNKR